MPVTRTTGVFGISCPSWCQVRHDDDVIDPDVGLRHAQTMAVVDLPELIGLRDETAGPVIVEVEQFATLERTYPVVVALRGLPDEDGCSFRVTEALAIASALIAAAARVVLLAEEASGGLSDPV
jgi:hypothetical protein